MEVYPGEELRVSGKSFIAQRIAKYLVQRKYLRIFFIITIEGEMQAMTPPIIFTSIENIFIKKIPDTFQALYNNLQEGCASRGKSATKPNKINRQTSMTTNLFTYGSLMCSDIMYHVAGCRADSIPATLKNFLCSKIHGEEYPGIIAQPGTEVKGVLYLNLPSEAMARLDSFEGEQYTRQEVQVITEHFLPFKAMCYIIKPENRTLLTGQPWSYQHFLTTGKAKFLAAYVGFQKI